MTIFPAPVKAFSPFRPSAALAAFLGALLAACSSTPKILPRNERNDPVFHQTDFTYIGVAGGPTWTRHDEALRYSSGPDLHDTVGGSEFVPAIYFNPRYSYTRMVGRAASYTLVPVYWNLLVTGDQYADSVNLAANRLHFSLHGGINGLSYSQRDGWVWSAEAALAGKCLLGSRGFLSAGASLHWDDLSNASLRRYRASLLAGRQLTGRGSLHAEYELTYYDLPEWTWANFRGIEFLGEDVQSDVNLRYTFYATPKHVFGPEAGVVFRDRGTADNFSLSLGAHYRFVFE